MCCRCRCAALRTPQLIPFICGETFCCCCHSCCHCQLPLLKHSCSSAGCVPSAPAAVRRLPSSAGAQRPGGHCGSSCAYACSIYPGHRHGHWRQAYGRGPLPQQMPLRNSWQTHRCTPPAHACRGRLTAQRKSLACGCGGGYSCADVCGRPHKRIAAAATVDRRDHGVGRSCVRPWWRFSSGCPSSRR